MFRIGLALGSMAAVLLSISLSGTASADIPFVRHTSKIDADPAKEYRLGKEHGPWMIMVSTFHASGDGDTDEGKTPEQAAHDLVIELRQKGIPAYVYVSEGKNEKIRTTDRSGREEIRKNLRRITTVCVLAGNYNSLNEERAQNTLKWLKKYRPKTFEDGVYVPPRTDRGPLSGAFLAINPLLSPEEVQSQSIDPLVMSLNSGMRNGLFENKGKYTLVIASFSGKSVAMTPDKQLPTAEEFLQKKQGNETNLDDAAENAMHLSEHLRGEVKIMCAPNEEISHRNIDAFVWHDQFRSIVTVGQFDSPNDPMIKKYRQVFAAKNVSDSRTGVTKPEMRFMVVKGYGKNREEMRMWVFDPNPQLMPVPRKR